MRENTMQVLVAQVNEEVPAPSRLQPDVPGDLEAVCNETIQMSRFVTTFGLPPNQGQGLDP